jgi:hypothetical protein
MIISAHVGQIYRTLSCNLQGIFF